MKLERDVCSRSRILLCSLDSITKSFLINEASSSDVQCASPRPAVKCGQRKTSVNRGVLNLFNNLTGEASG